MQYGNGNKKIESHKENWKFVYLLTKIVIAKYESHKENWKGFGFQLMPNFQKRIS